MAADKPLGEGRLANWLGLSGKGREAQVREAIEQLNAFYAEHDRAFRIDRLAGGWQLLTHPEISPLLDHVHHEKKRRELSPAQLETLSIVAWRQPVLRAEIDELRDEAESREASTQAEMARLVQQRQEVENELERAKLSYTEQSTQLRTDDEEHAHAVQLLTDENAQLRQQLADLTAAVAAQGRAQALEAARHTAEEAEGRERFRRFMGN